MHDASSPSEMMRQDARDQRMLRDEQDARWCDEDALCDCGEPKPRRARMCASCSTLGRFLDDDR